MKLFEFRNILQKLLEELSADSDCTRKLPECLINRFRIMIGCVLSYIEGKPGTDCFEVYDEEERRSRPVTKKNN